jgi:hypothetical protein
MSAVDSTTIMLGQLGENTDSTTIGEPGSIKLEFEENLPHDMPEVQPQAMPRLDEPELNLQQIIENILKANHNKSSSPMD